MDRRENGFLSPPQAGRPRVPAFPLSSPIAEEPTSPFDDESETNSNPFASPEDNIVKKESSTRGDNVAASRWSTDSGSTRRPGPWTSTKRLMRPNSKQTTPTKKTRPGLNLITDFSSPSAPTGKPPRPESRSRNGKAFLDLADLADLKSAPKQKDQANVQKKDARRLLWKRAARKAYTEIREQPPPDETHETQKSADRNIRDEISPSDRPIVIGMSVPRLSVDDNNGCGETAAIEADGSRDDRTPVTPSIVVTPADQDSPRGFDWNADSIPRSRSRPSRPPSSVYSQPTPRFGSKRVESIPPVPALPPNDNNTLFSNTSQSDDVFADNAALSTRKQRALSAGTVFEEDDNDSPPSENPRPRSLSDDDRHKTWTALDTPSRRQSQGWWNFLLSPLLSRSNTISSRTPQSARSPPPPLPSAVLPPPQSHPNFNEKECPRDVSAFSPDTPEAASADREKSMRSDITRWPDCRSGRDALTSPNGKPENKISPVSAASSSQTIPFMMSDGMDNSEGSPSSPCHACVYDSNPDPYFGSVNHTCSANRALQNSPPVGASPDGAGSAGVTTSPLGNSNSNNPFFQRFVASLRNSNPARPRSDSGSTTFEEDPPDISPTVREASATPMLRADGTSMTPTPITTRQIPNETNNNNNFPPAALDNSPTSGSQPPPYSPPKGKRYRAIFPPGALVQQSQQPPSPSPITPGTQNIISGGAGYPMTEPPQRPPVAHTLRSSREIIDSNDLPPRPSAAPVTLSAVAPDTRAANESRRRKREREDAYGRRVGGLWRGRGCFSNKGCFGRGRQGREVRKRRRWYAVIVSILLVIITLCIVLPILLTRKGAPTTPVESRWLNMTGYPPLPTGVSTIAGPNIATSRSGCIHPSTMWSCALPKEQQESNEPFDPDAPKFEIRIDFRNGSFDHGTAVAPPSADSAKRMRLRRDSSSAAATDKADPPPPSLEDMEFLGNTTDNITAPSFAGEETPFYATFLSALSRSSSRSRRRHKRADDKSPTFPNLTSAIPSPTTNPDGTAAPANLYPDQLTSQPIRLFDRDLATEHYGFYTYFDRSIFLKSAQPLIPSKDGEDKVVPDDRDGGSSQDAARVRCTWAQTRFLVQMWTKPREAGFALVGNHTDSTLTSTPTPSASPSASASASADDFMRPGSLPYPVTLTLDRHGGLAKEKMVYCYGMDVRGRIERDEKKLQLEFRGFGGALVNPAVGVFNLSDSGSDSGSGGGGDGDGDGDGVDGGTGGCMCEWRNWVAVS